MPNSGKKPKVSYLDNLKKEMGQLRGAVNKTADYADRARTYPSNSVANAGKGREFYGNAANTARKSQDKAMGQALGALLQGRRYDSNGKQIKK